jgi:hypothetical protein
MKGSQDVFFDFYVWKPAFGNHPLKYQAAWLKEEKDYNVANDELKKIKMMHSIEIKNDLPSTHTVKKISLKAHAYYTSLNSENIDLT